MFRSLTTPLLALVAVVPLVLAACDAGEELEVDDPVEVETVDDDAAADDGDGDFDSATASVEVTGDIEGSISLSSLRSADIVDGLFTATIASADAGEVLEVAAPAEDETATTGAGDVRLRLEVADPEADEVHTFEAGEGDCTITMAPEDVAVNGTFECTGLSSETGDLTIDASGSFAVNRD